MKKLKNDNELNGHHGATGRHEAYGLNGAYGLYGLNGACGRHGLNGVCGLRGALGSLSFFILLFFLCACSNDDTEEMTMESTTSVPVEVSSYVTRFEEANRAQRANRTQGTDGAYLTTRAWAVPTDYMAYEDGIQSIGIAFTKDGEDPVSNSMIGTFFYSSGKWRTSVETMQTTEENKPYYLYGYIPHLPAIKYSITDYNGGSTDEEKNAEYSKGAIMKLENVPTVMPKDLCVVIGAKQGTDKETVTGLRRGDFSVSAEETSDAAPKNFIFLLFDHLYSSLRMKMKVHPDYATLRTIKLKKLLLSTQVGTTTSKDHSDITITLQPNDGSASPITDISYTPTADALDIDGGIEFWSSDAGVDLTTQQTFTGHFMPSDITTLDLTSVYDVYDTQGNLLRENCRATNTMTLYSLSNQDEAHRGERYTVTMTIKPTYLYMLSEPDLESPTVVMEN